MKSAISFLKNLMSAGSDGVFFLKKLKDKNMQI